jgi:hypothetical protein
VPDQRRERTFSAPCKGSEIATPQNRDSAADRSDIAQHRQDIEARSLSVGVSGERREEGDGRASKGRQRASEVTDGGGPDQRRECDGDAAEAPEVDRPRLALHQRPRRGKRERPHDTKHAEQKHCPHRDLGNFRAASGRAATLLNSRAFDRNHLFEYTDVKDLESSLPSPAPAKSRKSSCPDASRCSLDRGLVRPVFYRSRSDITAAVKGAGSRSPRTASCWL